MQTKRGSTTLSTRRTTIKKTSCTYSLTVSFSNRKRFGTAKKLKFTVRFAGNERVLPITAASRFARIRR